MVKKKVLGGRADRSACLGREHQPRLLMPNPCATHPRMQQAASAAAAAAEPAGAEEEAVEEPARKKARPAAKKKAAEPKPKAVRRLRCLHRSCSPRVAACCAAAARTNCSPPGPLWLHALPQPHYLLKTEPAKFSIDDLAAKENQTDGWDGVRNAVARNNMRAMALNETGFLYHSMTKVKPCPAASPSITVLRARGASTPAPAACMA